ncbi:MAG: D-alanine--D-alanine ligase [Solirubrobacterales bacterium]|nr:D-alanine--D-alanine ligase [Solirubrobacterales bacterium]
MSLTSLSVAVLAGGRSSEREVSLKSGASVVAGLTEAGYLPKLIEISKEGHWTLDGAPVALSPGQGLGDFDIAFPVVHGPFGEDGTLQGLLESIRMPYVGSGVAASAIVLDKILAKQRLEQEGIPQVDYVGFTEADWLSAKDAVLAAARCLGSPVWVKPARLGSSVGISRVDDPASEGLVDAITTALTHDPRVIIEASCPGREIEVSVIEKIGEDGARTLTTSSAGEILLPDAAEGEWYDYDRKYKPGGMELAVPANLTLAQATAVGETARLAFERLGCEGYARVDTFVDGDQVLINEVNTSPGFTETSVFSRLFGADGVTYPDLLSELVNSALDRHARSARFTF